MSSAALVPRLADKNFSQNVFYGRGSPAKNLVHNSSNSFSPPPAPTFNVNESINAASGRAAKVLRQIKQSSSFHSSRDLSEKLLIRCASTPWYQYVIDFQPEISSRTTRFAMINHLAKHLGGLHKLYDGQFIYVPYQLSKEFFVFNNTTLNTPNKVSIRFIDTINIEHIPLDLINIFFRFAMDRGRESILNCTNRNGYHPKARSWSGKIVHMERMEDGLLLTIDFLQKSTTTCYEELERFYMSTSSGDYQESVRKELINKLVLTRYDHRTQRIDNIAFDLTPATFIVDDQSQTTLMDYYLSKFDIAIKDPDQPLIVYCPRRPGENISTEANYLIPELCYLTGLSDRAHRDARARKTYGVIPLDSAGRREELTYFDDMIRRNAATVKYLAEWGLNVVSNISSVHSSVDPSTRNLPHRDSSDENEEENEPKDTPDNEHSYGHFTRPVELHNWLLIYPRIDEDRAVIYVNMLRQVGQQQGMVVTEPVHVQMDDDETDSYANALRNHLNEQVQLVSVIVRSRRIDRYNTIKRICCIEIPTPTEIILRSTIADDDILPGVALNVARDINFKLGGQIRAINMAMPNTMFIGVATWTSLNVNYKSPEHLDYVLSIVGSMNYDMTEYFSHAQSYNNEDDLRADVGLLVQLAVTAYYEQNKIYPTTIVLGRSVLSSLDDLRLIQENEIQAIIDRITDESAMGNYKPRLVIFAFMKKMIYDSYNYVQPKKIPKVDCLVAKDSPAYCFYLSSHRDRCSTLQARQFLVLFDNSDLSAQRIQRLVLYLTYSIPQRNQFFLPCICRFAQRLSSLVGETLGAPPRCDRYKHLFYL